MAVLRFITLCRVMGRFRRFGGTCCLHFQSDLCRY